MPFNAIWIVRYICDSPLSVAHWMQCCLWRSSREHLQTECNDLILAAMLHIHFSNTNSTRATMYPDYVDTTAKIRIKTRKCLDANQCGLLKMCYISHVCNHFILRSTHFVFSINRLSVKWEAQSLKLKHWAANVPSSLIVWASSVLSCLFLTLTETTIACR